MKVRELIKILEQLDPDLPVLTSDCCFGIDDGVGVELITYYRRRRRGFEEVFDPEDTAPDADWSWRTGGRPEFLQGVKIK